MVIQAVVVNDRHWNTQTSSVWSYTVPKSIKLGNNRYNIAFTTKESIKRK